MKTNATYSETRSKDLTWMKHRDEKYWEYRKAWNDYPKALVVSDFPLHLDIETTNICNLECPFCPRTVQINEQRYGSIGVMSMDLYCKIIDEGVKNGLCSIKLNYLGEPLLDKFLIERIKYAKQKGIIEVMFNTNGMELTESKSLELLEAGLDSIFFSVDSIIPEEYEKMRPGANYKTVVNNIKKFCQLAKNYSHVQTRISMVVMEHNKDQVEDYTNFWLPIVGIVGYGEYVLHSSIDGITENYNPDFSCSQPFQRMFILWDGVCTPCCVDDARGFILGDANKTTIKDIWHGAEYEKLRDAQKNDYRDIDICKKCFMPDAKTDTEI